LLLLHNLIVALVGATDAAFAIVVPMIFFPTDTDALPCAATVARLLLLMLLLLVLLLLIY
jgi:hypothetical protein